MQENKINLNNLFNKETYGFHSITMTQILFLKHNLEKKLKIKTEINEWKKLYLKTNTAQYKEALKKIETTDVSVLKEILKKG